MGNLLGHLENCFVFSFLVIQMAFPDLVVTVEDQIAEGDRVVTRWTARGTHGGEFLGIPPTGKEFTFKGVDIVRIVDGKIVEGWDVPDLFGLMRQLGLIPI